MGYQTSERVRETMLYEDVDGTLIGSTGTLSPAVQEAVERFVRAGYSFSKWNGILVSQLMRGCRDKRIVPVGDHCNDLEMIAEADLGIAMGNAVKKVKQVASECIGGVDEEAVVDLLDWLRVREQSADCVSKWLKTGS